MRLAFDILKATTKLEITADTKTDAVALAACMKEVAAELTQAVENASATWGTLTHAVKALEKGERFGSEH